MCTRTSLARLGCAGPGWTLGAGLQAQTAVVNGSSPPVSQPLWSSGYSGKMASFMCVILGPNRVGGGYLGHAHARQEFAVASPTLQEQVVLVSSHRTGWQKGVVDNNLSFHVLFDT